LRLAKHNGITTIFITIEELGSGVHLVVKHRSFMKAAQAAGVTQSAITRQMQGIEDSLGIDLLERTTRSVRITKAGEFLFRESTKLLGDVDQSLRRLKEDFANARKEIHQRISVGWSRLFARILPCQSQTQSQRRLPCFMSTKQRDPFSVGSKRTRCWGDLSAATVATHRFHHPPVHGCVHLHCTNRDRDKFSSFAKIKVCLHRLALRAILAVA